MKAVASVAVASLVLALSGCGGDDSGESEARSRPTPTSAPVETAPAPIAQDEPAIALKPACRRVFNAIADVTDWLSTGRYDYNEAIQWARSEISEVAADGPIDLLDAADRLAYAIDDTVDAGRVSQAVGAEFEDTTGELASLCEAVLPGSFEGTKHDLKPKPKPKPKPEPVRVGDGTYEVGRDIPAGTYRNDGPSPDDGRLCVAYASSKPGDIGTYLRGSTSKGPGIVQLNPGEYFTVAYCAPWRKD